jgi:hypothetical protein
LITRYRNYARRNVRLESDRAARRSRLARIPPPLTSLELLRRTLGDRQPRRADQPARDLAGRSAPTRAPGSGRKQVHLNRQRVEAGHAARQVAAMDQSHGSSLSRSSQSTCPSSPGSVGRRRYASAFGRGRSGGGSDQGCRSSLGRREHRTGQGIRRPPECKLAPANCGLTSRRHRQLWQRHMSCLPS